MGKSKAKKKDPLLKVFSFLYILLAVLFTTAFLVFMVLLRPLLTHPDFPKNIGTYMFFLMIVLMLLTGVSGMLIFTLLEKKKVV
jgi:hypothetical protein